MRSKFLRALSFAAAGAVVLLTFNFIWAVFREAPRTYLWAAFAQGQMFMCVVSAAVLFVGALGGFGLVRKNLASFRIALLLGALASIPAALTASALILEAGLFAAVVAAIVVAAAIAFVGGGGLRGGVSHG
jgi:predicted nucleic acid-binding protein